LGRERQKADTHRARLSRLRPSGSHSDGWLHRRRRVHSRTLLGCLLGNLLLRRRLGCLLGSGLLLGCLLDNLLLRRRLGRLLGNGLLGCLLLRRLLSSGLLG